MKIATILSIAGLMIFSVIGLAQTSSAEVSLTQSATPVTSPQTTTITPLPTTITPIYSCNNDGKCDTNIGETTTNCEKDCFQATTLRGTCGDKICQSTESKSSCSVDCGYPWVCGDGICGGTETDWNCPQDCSQPTTTPITPAVTPQATTVSPPQAKCGVNSFAVSNECGLGVYKNVYVQCYDGYETNLGAVESSCKPSELWNQYANEACASHCSNGGGSGTASTPVSTPLMPPTTRPTEIPKAISVCYISSDLMQQYSQLILELQKSESDKARAEEITKQIIELKQQIATQQNECVRNSPQPTPTIVPWPAPTSALRSTPMASPIAVENIPIAVSIDRCNEVAQWENKIVYYKKLSGLNDADLGKEGFSRDEIEKILQELSLGIEKVRAQCSNQGGTIAAPPTAITGSAFITETVRPVVAESGQEITIYYKARLEKAVSAKGKEKQIEELKTLRDEIDGLISNLIKSRKELEVSELNTLVKEVKVSRGEIKADDIVVKTTEKKILVSVGDRPVSIEPTASQVVIRDKGLEVNTNEVMIKENVLSVGGIDVKMSASEVTEKLGLAPKTIELKEENDKAVYNMKIDERRKLFGFIPLNSQKTVTVDAENGDTLSERLPWYGFLTTK